MTAPYATVPDHRTPSAPARSVPRWVGILAGLVAVVVLAVVVGLGADEPAPSDVRPVASVVVDGTSPVVADDGIVATACFSFRVPDGLALDPQSAGCTTAVGFGHDSLTQIYVGVRTSASGELDEVVADLRQAMDGVGDVEMETLTVKGRKAARLGIVDGWGIHRTWHLVSLPTGRFTQTGKPLTYVVIMAPASPEFDEWVATILDSLEIAD